MLWEGQMAHHDGGGWGLFCVSNNAQKLNYSYMGFKQSNSFWFPLERAQQSFWILLERT
jgi:hypothetical protein